MRSVPNPMARRVLLRLHVMAISLGFICGLPIEAWAEVSCPDITFAQPLQPNDSKTFVADSDKRTCGELIGNADYPNEGFRIYGGVHYTTTRAWWSFHAFERGSKQQPSRLLKATCEGTGCTHAGQQDNTLCMYANAPCTVKFTYTDSDSRTVSVSLKITATGAATEIKATGGGFN